jgi:hypothetical protein
MRPSTLFLKLAVATLLGMACAAASAANPSKNIVVNGSFQDNNIGNVPWTYLSSVVGWTSTGPFEIEKGSNAGGLSGFNTTDKGSQYLELDSTELTTVSQDLHTKKGATYDLSFDFSGRADTPGGTASEMAVYWNGKEIGVVTEPAKSGWHLCHAGRRSGVHHVCNAPSPPITPRNPCANARTGAGNHPGFFTPGGWPAD